MNAADDVVVASWSRHCEVGHRYEDLRADGQTVTC